ncbi:CAMK kinase [Fusarium sp. NRRL 52700]|nr:CAMK kinase [Fusarium sp. NRRL 52700]
MHEEGFTHRDVKPQNILIFKPPVSLDPRSWWVKLADFGISKKLTTETTGTTMAPGTPLYMAPELLQSDYQRISTEGHRMADAWAIGITTFFILTKTVPFKSQLAAWHYTGSSEDLVATLTHSKATESAQDFVCKLLNPRPGGRLDAAEARQHLWIHHWLPEIPVSAAHSKPSTISSRHSSLQDHTGTTREISTLASQTASQRGTGDFHDPPILPKTPEEMKNINDIPVMVQGSKVPIEETESIAITRSPRPRSIDKSMPNLQQNGTSLDAHTSQQLHRWIEAGNIDMTRMLVDLGADVNSADSNVQSPLHSYTPLQLAARNGRAEIAELLLEKGANIEAAHIVDASTPLNFAVSMKHAAVTSLLLDNGANVEARSRGGVRALHSAAWSGSEALLELLLQHGAYIEATDHAGRTPLMMAAEQGHLEAVRLLLGRNAHFNRTSVSTPGPLIEAARAGHEAVVKVLLEKDAAIEARDPSGDTALVHAVRGNREAVVALLLRMGANAYAEDIYGVACLMIATENRNKTIMDLLVQHGVKKGWSYYRARLF